MRRIVMLVLLTTLALILGACGGGTAINGPNGNEGIAIHQVRLSNAPILSDFALDPQAVPRTASDLVINDNAVNLKITSTNPEEHAEWVILCLWHDPAEDNQIDMDDAEDYLMGLPAPGHVDIKYYRMDNNPLPVVITDFNGSPLAKDERYWLTALFKGPDDVTYSPCCDPLCLYLLPGDLDDGPVLEVMKSFRGDVTGCDGMPLESALVEYVYDGAVIEGRYTDSTGHYEFWALAEQPSGTSSLRGASRGESDSVTGHVLRASHSSYAGLSPLSEYLDPYYVSFDVDFAFNAGPTAGLSAAPTTGEPPLYVEFDATGSTDPDHGVIVRYDWDWDGDGTWDLIDAGAEIGHLYGADGTYTATVRVWDAAGTTDTASVTVEVSSYTPGTWTSSVVTPLNGSSWNYGIACNSLDQPSISYAPYNAGAVQLHRARFNGTSWIIESVPAADHTGRHSAICFDSTDQPHFSFTREYYGDDAIIYGYWPGAGWYDETIEAAGDVHYSNTDIAIDSIDYKHVAFRVGVSGTVKYAVGPSWTPVTVDSGLGHVSDYMLNYVTIEVDSLDHPHMAYSDEDDGNLKYAYFDGSTWHTEVVESANDVGYCSSLALDALDHPHICHYDKTNQDLRYVYNDGSGWQASVVDSAGDVGSYCSLVLDSAGTPKVIYRDLTNTQLKHAVHNGTGWDFMVVDDSANVGRFAVMTVDSQDHLHVAYYDSTNDGLKYAHWEP